VDGTTFPSRADLIAVLGKRTERYSFGVVDDISMHQVVEDLISFIL